MLKTQKVIYALIDKNLEFNECDSRMNYNLIGNLSENKVAKVTIYPTTFYVLDGMFAISASTLELIQNIQEAFVDLTRDKNGKITTFKNPTL
jgi:hypothetical protein